MRLLTSLQHPIVKHLAKLRGDGSYRCEHQTLLIEGIKPIQEIHLGIKKILYTPAYASFVENLAGEKWETSEAVINKISGMSSPEGVIAEVAMPSFISLKDQKRVLALDGISDPGNMGTLLRTALAFGWDVVYFLPGCCDPFNDKVIRSARGAHFKLPLAKGSVDELLLWIKNNDIQACVADITGTRAEDLPSAVGRVLILGNEAHGPSARMREFCMPITLPMPGEMESLNVAVAGGILLYLLRRN